MVIINGVGTVNGYKIGPGANLTGANFAHISCINYN